MLRVPGARGSDDPEGSFPSFFPALKAAIRNIQLRRSQVWFPPLRGSGEDLTGFTGSTGSAGSCSQVWVTLDIEEQRFGFIFEDSCGSLRFRIFHDSLFGL